MEIIHEMWANIDKSIFELMVTSYLIRWNNQSKTSDLLSQMMPILSKQSSVSLFSVHSSERHRVIWYPKYVSILGDITIQRVTVCLQNMTWYHNYTLVNLTNVQMQPAFEDITVKSISLSILVEFDLFNNTGLMLIHCKIDTIPCLSHL